MRRTGIRLQWRNFCISTIEDARHNQEPTISIAAEDIQGLELSGDTNAAMPQIRDLAIDTNANEKQAQAS